MNCAECKELLVASLEGLLDDLPKQAVKEHLDTCETCRAELKSLQTLRERLVGNGKALAQDSVEDEVMNRIVREQNARLKSVAQAGESLRIRRLIMRSSVVKIAVTAAVVLVALGAWSMWSGTQSGVALADVLVKVEQVQAFLYKMTMHMKGQLQGSIPLNANTNGSILIANEYGMRMDISTTDPNSGVDIEQQMYMLPQRKLMLIVLPKLKKYTRMELDESMFAKMRKQNNDPRMLIRQVLDCQYQELGRSVIDGVEVEGFQTTDPAYAGNALGDVDVKIWIDVKTQLPVRMDMKIKIGEEMQMEGTMHDFQWDVPVSAAEFDPVLPEDFTAGPGDGMKIPAMTEETGIEGLRHYVAFTGEYPVELNMMALMQKVKDFKDSQTPEGQKLREALEQAKTVDEKTKVLLQPMMSVQMLGGFYATLVQEQKEPAYYGKTVQPGDVASVLLRWKTGDNEYRVIFGDLHAETVDADTLAKLEAALPK
ncbi:MAG: zf-HC2 domain-containing protein [Phycisphaerales bacterium]